MRIECKFRHQPVSAEVEAYAAEHVSKLAKFERKSGRVEFTFTAGKTMKRVDIHIHDTESELHAHAEAADYFVGIDLALAKIGRQLERQAGKIKSHHGRNARKSLKSRATKAG